MDYTRGTSAISSNKCLAVQWLKEVLCFITSSEVVDRFEVRNYLLSQTKKGTPPCKTKYDKNEIR